jgi:hypothetical protein
MLAGNTFVTKNGQLIIVPKNAVEHMAAHPIADPILREAILQLSVGRGKWYVGTADLGRIVGKSGCVTAAEVDADEPALFAFRKNRKYASRCVIGEGMPTSHVTVVARQGSYGDYFFVSAWCGVQATPEPTNLNQKDNMQFWCNNALIWSEEAFEEKPRMSTWRDVINDRRRLR